MANKIYSFADCCVTVFSDREIADSGMFRHFICEGGKEKINIKLVFSELPQKCGTLIYSDKINSFYENDGETYLYTSYPKNGEYIEYACRHMKGEEITLYVTDCEKLWDSMIMEALKVPEILLTRNIATVHCSFIEVCGEAVLFAANKQMGKSTQAALWNKHRGAQIINGDRAAVKIENGRVYACGIPFCGSSKIALNKVLPVRAVVFPDKAKTSTAVRVDPMSAFFEFLGKLTYEPSVSSQLETAVDIAKFVTENLPVFRLSCLPDESAVIALEEALCQI